MMELLFHVQIGGIFEIFVEEIDLARVALSCHFAIDLLCDKAGTQIPRNALLGTVARGGSLFCYTIATLALCSSGYIKKANTSVDVVDASHKLRGSVPVKNSTLYPATLNAGLRGNGSRWIQNSDHRHCLPHFGCP